MCAAALINHSRALSTSDVGLNFWPRAAPPFGPGSWHQPGPMPTFSPSWCHQPGPKVSFRQPRGREAETFGPGWWHQPGLKGGIGPGWCHEPGPKALPARGQKFSPTSLVEGAREWFISAAAHTLSSSSQQQAYGPNCTIFACGPTGPSAGLNPRPTSGWVCSRIQAVVAQ